jgi:hypothetical protein
MWNRIWFMFWISLKISIKEEQETKLKQLFMNHVFFNSMIIHFNWIEFFLNKTEYWILKL